jgi:hypothetical protein
MKKEVLAATIIGSLLGLFLAFGFYKANRAVKNKAQTVSIPTSAPAQPNATEKIEEEIEFKITDPKDFQVFFSQTATISGQAAKNSPIVITTENDEYIILTDETGKFSQPCKLVKGINEIDVSYLKNMEELEETNLNLIYTTDKI